jgi:OmpA-OmpF porin, OOP family
MRTDIAKEFLIISVATLVFVACATAPKDELSSSANPRDEIERLSSDLSAAQEANIDVLARKDYLKSSKFLENAKDDLAKGKDQEKIIDDLRFGRQSLKKAYAAAESRKDKVPGLFKARQSAIQAGAAQSAKLKKEWESIDEDVAGNADRIDKVAPENLEQYQNRYVELEKKAVVETQLGKASAQISGARNDGATKSAPEALRKAEISLNNAESLIGSNLNSPVSYRPAVAQANNDSLFLSEVVETVKQNGKSLTEPAAAQIVFQRRQIADLKKNLSTSEENVADAKQDTRTAQEAVAGAKQDTRAAQARVDMQTALEKSRQSFSPNEAEAYQQGGNLLIRLKSMSFQSGRSELPTQHLALLAKVSEVAKSLNAKEIKIEGHTDAVGSSEVNKKLSEQRAGAVATYFKANGFEGTQVLSEGHGFEKPIATNKSKAGRAQNRRVDIIIMPLTEPTSVQ